MLTKENAETLVAAFAGAWKQLDIKDGISDRPYLLGARRLHRWPRAIERNFRRRPPRIHQLARAPKPARRGARQVKAWADLRPALPPGVPADFFTCVYAIFLRFEFAKEHCHGTPKDHHNLTGDDVPDYLHAIFIFRHFLFSL